MKGNELIYLAERVECSQMVGDREWHFIKAINKHPDFIRYAYSAPGTVEQALYDARRKITTDRERLGGDCFDSLIQCEMYEAISEMKQGNWDKAIDELYDLITLCDRMICLCKNRDERLFEGRGNE